MDPAEMANHLMQLGNLPVQKVDDSSDFSPTHVTKAGTPVVHILDKGDISKGLGYSNVIYPNGKQRSVPNMELTPIGQDK